MKNLKKEDDLLGTIIFGVVIGNFISGILGMIIAALFAGLM